MILSKLPELGDLLIAKNTGKLTVDFDFMKKHQIQVKTV